MLTIEFINEDEEVAFTTHGDERRTLRDGKWVGVPRERIEKIIHSNFERMKKLWPKHDTFVFRNPIDGLHIVGELQKRGDDWTFKVVTVIFKHGFNPYHGDKIIKVYESTNLMMFESFMETYDAVLEIASEDGDLFEYEQIESDEDDGTFSWSIRLDDEGRYLDDIILTIKYQKDPATRPEMTAWMERFEDFIECLGMYDGFDSKQRKSLHSNFDAKKWSKMIDIAEVEMVSNKMDYEKTGYGKAVALKLLRTRFHIIRGWINAYKPDVFISLPKKESQEDNRRMRIYELYFKKYLNDYSIITKDMTNARPWFSADILVCLSNRINDRIISSLEKDVEEAIL